MKKIILHLFAVAIATVVLGQETRPNGEIITNILEQNARYGIYFSNPPSLTSQEMNATNKPPEPGASIETISLWRINRVPGTKFLYNKTNPLPRIAEVPGKFWLKTNGWGSVISNGVSYSYIVIQTNYGPKKSPIIVNTQTEEEMRVDRERRKEIDRLNGVNQDVRDREEKLKAEAKALHKGMSPQEVLNVLGPPYTLTARKEIGLNQYSNDPIAIEDLPGHEPFCMMRYAPYKSYTPFKAHGPYQTLEVLFDENGKLWIISWL